MRRVIKLGWIISLEIRFAPRCKWQRADPFRHVWYIRNFPHAGKIGLPSGRRGAGPLGVVTAVFRSTSGATDSDCAEAAVAKIDNAAHAIAEIK
jgi:hypothetical protein